MIVGCARPDAPEKVVSIASTSLHRRVPHRYSRWPLVALVGLLALGVWFLVRSGGPDVVTQPRLLAPFSAVDLTGSNVVSIRVGPRQSVVVRARKDMLGRVATTVHDGTLVIANTPRPGPTKGPTTVSVALPSITALRITGSGVITADDIKASSLIVDVPGSGLVRASGTTDRLTATVGGSGSLELGPLVARRAQAVVRGDGEIALTVTDTLDAAVPGSGAIRYSGNPAHVTTSVTGSGAILPG